MKKITIVSPCYNEEDNVRTCYEVVRDLFDGALAGYAREHIFADNASTDRTQEILRDVAAEDDAVKVVINARNYGPFRSNFNALRYATGDAIVVFLAVDLQDPPEVIVDFVRHWEAGAEVVAGARTDRQESLLLRTCRAIFYRIVKTLSEIDIPLNVGEFQLIDRKVWAAVIQHDDHYPYIRGLIASVGFNRVIIPYKWNVRKSGLSKNNTLRLIDQALNGIFSFTNAPLRICTFVGFGLAFACIMYSLVVVALYIFGAATAPKGIATIIISLFFLSGIQLAFIGMLGEYVTSIHAQVRRGPVVIERETINMVGRSPAHLTALSRKTIND